MPNKIDIVAENSFFENYTFIYIQTNDNDWNWNTSENIKIEYSFLFLFFFYSNEKMVKIQMFFLFRLRMLRLNWMTIYVVKMNSRAEFTLLRNFLWDGRADFSCVHMFQLFMYNMNVYLFSFWVIFSRWRIQNIGSHHIRFFILREWWKN